MLKKLGISFATGALIFTLLLPKYAEASKATDLGMKLAEKVAGLIIGEAFTSLFGDDSTPPAVTKAEVQSIVDAGFSQAALDALQVSVGKINKGLDIFNHLSPWSDNTVAIGLILEGTGDAWSQATQNINHDNFVPVVRAYMTAVTVRLVFLSERRRFKKETREEAIDSVGIGTDMTAQQIADKKEELTRKMVAEMNEESRIIASTALDALTDMSNFFYEDFYENGPAKQGCIYKYPETPWVTNGVLGSNTDTEDKNRATVNCRHYDWILPQGVSYKTYKGMIDGKLGGSDYTAMNIFATTPWQSTDVMPVHRNDYWAFSFKKWQNNPGPHIYDYHMMVVKGEDLARYVRNLNSITKYPNWFGDIEGLALRWIDIIAANGDTNQFASALMKATKLGVEHSTLVNRYKDKHGEMVYHFEKWYTGKLSEWGLSRQYAPTRIEFNPKEYYPTDAPAWLKEAMN
ncbi:MAG TPA: hypothetical protein VIM93_04390 [Kangiella sp.]|uniref:hypothetical protein n=1 Tax=Kangiella sp. TaxID=1920245 RepID=UPI002F9207DE